MAKWDQCNCEPCVKRREWCRNWWRRNREAQLKKEKLRRRLKKHGNILDKENKTT